MPHRPYGDPSGKVANRRGSVLRMCAAQPGCRARSANVRTVSCGGMAKPFRTSLRLKPLTVVSTVMTAAS
jgi:hypothetical protein